VKSLPWHHVHVTLAEREAAAKWHDLYTPATRVQPTKRSENLFCGSNLLQIQSTAVASKPQNGYIDSIGIGVLSLSKAVTEWKSAGGTIDLLTTNYAKVRDPWGLPVEFVEKSNTGYTHINITAGVIEQLRDWYEKNLGGTRVTCEWDSTRLALMYDTMLIVFNSVQSNILSPGKPIIDHIGWYTDDVDGIFHQLSMNGVRFPGKPRDYGPVRLAFAEDPCGIWIELHILPRGGKPFMK
jgi:hypothetical protein